MYEYSPLQLSTLATPLRSWMLAVPCWRCKRQKTVFGEFEELKTPLMTKSRLRALFARFNVDAEAEFQRIHRTRVPPRRLDPNPETQTNMSMATFYRKEVFLFLDTMVEVLSAKINGLEDSFRLSIEVLDPNLFPTIDKVVKLANQFPSDIPDPEAFLAELEIFNGYYNKVKVERCETKWTIRDAAELAMKCNREKMLFPQVAKIYCLFLTSPPSVCKS